MDTIERLLIQMGDGNMSEMLQSKQLSGQDGREKSFEGARTKSKRILEGRRRMNQ